MNIQQQTLTVKLTPHQFEWLQVFLERSKLRGKEVPHFLGIVGAIRAAGASAATEPQPASQEVIE